MFSRAGALRCSIAALLLGPSEARVVISVDVGTESTRAAVFDSSGKKLGSASSAHTTQYPEAGWAEQQPEDWWAGLGVAVSGALQESGCAAGEVAALCMATTSCTVMACDADGTPLRPALLWMDARSAAQAEEILERGRGDPALARNCGGDGPISAEWMLCKALWLKQREPDVWQRAATICECQDWLQFRCTGRLTAGGCNVATRWHCDGVAACGAGEGGGFGGRPLSLLRRVGLEDLSAKWPRECVPVGALQGTLTREAAKHLGLREGTPLAQGGADAHIGLVGLGAATTTGAVGLITGSSHLHLAIVDAAEPRTARGVWGAYPGAPLSQTAMAEGGQSSTGAAIQWARRLFSGPQSGAEGGGAEGGGAEGGGAEGGGAEGGGAEGGGAEGGGGVPLRLLDEEAAGVPIGCEGVSALETFQGSRTPVTDPLARGALVGLSLKHSRGHVWRALLEAVCLGTRAAVEGLAAATGEPASLLLAAGGATRSPFWLQMHADVCGVPVVVGECPDAPLLGGAVIAAALPGSLHADASDSEAPSPPSSPREAIARATAAMVRTASRVEPDPAAAAQYEALYRQRYVHLAPLLSPLSHRSAAHLAPLAPRLRPLLLPRSRRAAVVQPSLLAADKGTIAAAARELAAAGAEWVHVDICDGTLMCGRMLSGLGPGTVLAIREAAPSLRIDVHLYTMEPEAHVAAVAGSGAHRITFQLEALGDGSAPAPAAACARAKALAAAIREAGCAAGVCIAPATPVEAVFDLCRDGAVDLVDILAVEPGIGGQRFQPAVLDKVAALRAAHPQLPFLLVDGGIDDATAPAAVAAGANALVSGSYIFRAAEGKLGERLDVLERALLEHGD